MVSWPLTTVVGLVGDLGNRSADKNHVNKCCVMGLGAQYLYIYQYVRMCACVFIPHFYFLCAAIRYKCQCDHV